MTDANSFRPGSSDVLVSIHDPDGDPTVNVARNRNFETPTNPSLHD